MHESRKMRSRVLRVQPCPLRVVTVLLLLSVPGCPSWLPRDCWAGFHVRGRLVDSATGEPAVDVAYGMRTLTAGEQTSRVSTVLGSGEPRLPNRDDEGGFELVVGTGIRPCDPPPEFPRPDQVDMIVVRDGCEFSFLIDVNEDTVVDMTFPDDVLELRDPILVPACEE